jgi:hypothetical protein
MPNVEFFNPLNTLNLYNNACDIPLPFQLRRKDPKHCNVTSVEVINLSVINPAKKMTLYSSPKRSKNLK